MESGHRMRGRTGGSWAAVLLAAACAAEENPNQGIVDALPTCAECAIVVEAIWSSEGVVEVPYPPQLFFETPGLLWGAVVMDTKSIMRVQLDAGILAWSEREGGAPGEFQDQVRNGALHPSGDSLVLAEERRVHVFDLALEEARAFTPEVPVRYDVVVLEDGSLVVANDRAAAADDPDMLLHALSATGALLGSFAPRDSADSGDDLPLIRGAEPNTVWVLRRHLRGFTAEQWGVSPPELVRTHRFQKDWWYSGGLPPEEIEGLVISGGVIRSETIPVDAFDDGTVLWVVLAHADAAWEEVTDYALAGETYDGILLALDRDSGQVLAAELFDAFAAGFTNRGNLVLTDHTETGAPRIQLRSVRLVRP